MGGTQFHTKQTNDCGNCSIPDTAAWLHCGDLVAHHVVADDIVTITDVQAFFRYGRRQQKVLLSSLESFDDPLLLILSHANYNWRKLNEQISIVFFFSESRADTCSSYSII